MKYTIAVDFDGVIHSYTSPWINAETIPDAPVDGAFAWLQEMTQSFDVVIHSTRCKTQAGMTAMAEWFTARGLAAEVAALFIYSYEKLPALVYIDDCAYRFTGSNFPTVQEVHAARPWNKQPAAAENLQQRELPYLLELLRHEVLQWQEETFPTRTSASITKHLAKEARELRDAPTDARELADVQLLLWAAFDAAGVDIFTAVREKLAENRKRQWNAPDAEGVVEHVKDEDDVSPAPYDCLQCELSSPSLAVMVAHLVDTGHGYIERGYIPPPMEDGD